MPTDAVDIECRNQDCRVLETGKCVEALALDKCPHVIRDAGEPQPAAGTEVKEEEGATPDIQLSKSERLPVSEASAVLRSASTRVAAIIGPTSCGKTSMIASLCDLFQRKKIGSLQFAGSRTLFAFEQACHDARAASRRTTPESEHTSLASGLGFYHLAMRKDANPDIVHLLLADRSGEDYRSAADDPSISGEFIEIRRADTIAILVDGKLFLDLKARNNVRHEIGMILQGLLDGETLSSNQKLALVLTKLDMIKNANAADRERTEREYERLVKHIEQNFGHVFREIRSFRIAASPKSTVLPHGFGVSDVLEFWTEASAQIAVESLPLPKAARAMGRFRGSGTGSGGLA